MAKSWKILGTIRPVDMKKIIFLYFSTETYVVGTQKNCLNETVLLSTQDLVKTEIQENNYNLTLKNCYLDQWYYVSFASPYEQPFTKLSSRATVDVYV